MSNNYENDHRVRGIYRRMAPLTVSIDGQDHILPTHKVVCPTCSGTGKHVNPSIDCDGLTREDFDQDPDFREDYFSGAYDVTCYECGGNNVVDAIDWDRVSPELTKAYEDEMDERCEYEAMCRAERRMGA